ncbi:MAG TPA: glutathione S-transferase family protein [Alphaproteobacteria bacterium]|nr:glutathione S-transferase family protein [Alphaproteobacteria bacterium]
MYRLYGAKGSGSAMVEAALAETGAAYEVAAVGLGTDEQRGESYRELNPTRKIPALVLPSGAVIAESAAILITLAERHPESKLLPSMGSDERAQALRWLVSIVAEIYPMIEIRDYPKRFAIGEKNEETIINIARNRARERWLSIERAIAGSPWLLPTGFSIADLAIANVSRWTIGKDWRIANLSKIEAIHAGILARPKAGKVWASHFGA